MGLGGLKYHIVVIIALLLDSKLKYDHFGLVRWSFRHENHELRHGRRSKGTIRKSSHLRCSSESESIFHAGRHRFDLHKVLAHIKERKDVCIRSSFVLS